MTYDIFIIVLLAAMMHAAWNAIVKGAADRTLTFGLVATGHMLPALMIAPFVPLPPPEAVLRPAQSDRPATDRRIGRKR